MKPPVVVTYIISRNREKSTAIQNIFLVGYERGGGDCYLPPNYYQNVIIVDNRKQQALRRMPAVSSYSE